MSPAVTGVVLLAALMHAGWNAIAKAIPNRLVASALIGLAYLVVAGVGILIFPVPEVESWWAIITSALLQTVYLILLTAAYAKMDFSKAYPLTRGIAVLGVTAVSVGLLGEAISSIQMTGVLMVVAALMTLAFGAGWMDQRGGLLLALMIGLIIASYSLADGVGVRVSGTPMGYASWNFFLQGFTVPAAAWFLSDDRPAFVEGLRSHAGRGLLGGVLSLVAYYAVVWAQSIAPLSMVSALRETGVIMAAFIGYLVFKEKLTPAKVIATVVAAAGIVLIRL